MAVNKCTVKLWASPQCYTIVEPMLGKDLMNTTSTVHWGTQINPIENFRRCSLNVPP